MTGTCGVSSAILLVAAMAMSTGPRVNGGADSAAPVGDPPKVAVLGWHGTNTLPNAPLTIGLAEELTHRLQTSPDVVVRGPTHALVARQGNAAGRGKHGDVDFVLWLAATTSGPRLRVTWELERLTDGLVLLADTSSPETRLLAELPSRIAGNVLEKLGVTGLSISARDAHLSIAEREAYADFVRLLGQSDDGKDERATLLRRIDALESLTAKLGPYVPAVASLGSDYLDLAGLAGGRSPYYERATRSLERAVGLDHSYPPARAKLASLYAKVGRSERAVELLTRGLVTHPYFAPYHETLGYVLRYAGLMERPIASYRRGQEFDASLDNLVSTQDQITKSLIYLGEYVPALESHRRMRSLLETAGRSPDEKQWFYEGVIHLYRGDTTAAVQAFRTGARLMPGSIWTTFGRGYEAIALGDRAGADAVLRELERYEVVDGERHYRLVHFATFAGQLDRGLDHLEKSINAGFFNAPYIARDPWLAPLRAMPRFERLVSAARARHEAVQRVVEPPRTGVRSGFEKPRTRSLTAIAGNEV